MALRIVAVNGAPTAGKTTFELMVRDIRMKQDEKITSIWSVVAPIKEMAETHFGIGRWDDWGKPPQKTPELRRFYSDLKDTFDRYCNYTYTNCLTEINGYYCQADSTDILLFIDARESKDLQMLKDKFNATVICIRRASAENLEASNHADADVLNFKYDYEIWNNGTEEDLKELAYKFCEEVEGFRTYEFD